MASTDKGAGIFVRLGLAQFIVRRDDAIPAGEIHVGSYAALDALTGFTQPAQAPAQAPDSAQAAGLRIVRRRRGLEPRYTAYRLSKYEREAIRSWLPEHAAMMTDFERAAMFALFPPGKPDVQAEAICHALNTTAAAIREIRKDVFERAGIRPKREA